MSPEIFPKGFFDEDFDNIILALQDDHDKNMMRGYQASINAGAYNPKLINNLKKYLNELDARRGTSWKPLFPWLDTDYE
jgi:hypothetical protein